MCAQHDKFQMYMGTSSLHWPKIFLHQGNESATLPVVQLERAITPWFMKPGGSMSRSQGLSNNPYPKLNQPNSSH